MKPAIVNKKSDTQVEVIRKFEASAELVWKPFTEADLISKWMIGPPGWSMPVCEMDFRVGGEYKNVFKNDADGMEIQISGTIREIEPLAKIVQDEKHAIGGTESGTTVTLTFEAVDGHTTVTTLIEYGSEKERDEALATGMETAMEMGYCRIDELVVN